MNPSLACAREAHGKSIGKGVIALFRRRAQTAIDALTGKSAVLTEMTARLHKIDWQDVPST